MPSFWVPRPVFCRRDGRDQGAHGSFGIVAIANGGLLRGKIGAGVVAVRRGGGTHVFDTMNHLFQISEMIVPGSTYWNIGYGLNKGEVLNDTEGLANMRHLGSVIAWLGRAMAYGFLSCQPP